MLRIKSFQGLRPPPHLAPEVACVPYDVVNREEAALLARGHPDSLLHVDRAEIDLPPGIDPYSSAVYEKAAENFRSLQQRGALMRERAPCLYVYRQTMGTHSQVGIAAVCHIEDYERDIIKKHEKTRRDKEDDRTRLIATLRADTGPVFLTYRDNAAIDQLITEITRGAPLSDFVAPDGIGHTVWRIGDCPPWINAFSRVPVAYVADGHHRTASAVRVGREQREANPQHTGAEEYNWFLAVLFPASQLQILPYNRAIVDLHGNDDATFLGKVRERFLVRDSGIATPSKPGEISMYFRGQWRSLEWQSPGGATPIARLDVSGLQDRLLQPVLGIDDPRTSKRIEFIGGIRGTKALESLVDSNEAAVAFSMFPTTVEQLMAIADANEIMPPKSTWFEPKLRSGLFIHTF